jgi:hypothetical protein
MFPHLLLLLVLLIMLVIPNMSVVLSIPYRPLLFLAVRFPSKERASGDEPRFFPQDLVDLFQRSADYLGDEGPHGDGVGEGEDTEDDVVFPTDRVERVGRDLSDHKVCASGAWFSFRNENRLGNSRSGGLTGDPSGHGSQSGPLRPDPRGQDGRGYGPRDGSDSEGKGKVEDPRHDHKGVPCRRVVIRRTGDGGEFSLDGAATSRSKSRVSKMN